MAKQLIISISREYASGGRFIAENLAKRFDLPLYDSNLLHEIAESKNRKADKLLKYDETPKNRFLSRSVRGFNNSLEENIARMQFDYLREKAEKGDSFVVLGRCAETVLEDFEGLVSVFVLADKDFKVERVMEAHNISRTGAELLVERQNRARKSYHNYYCTGKWGDSRNYDISINSCKLGLERTIDILEEYIKERMQ